MAFVSSISLEDVDVEAEICMFIVFGGGRGTTTLIDRRYYVTRSAGVGWFHIITAAELFPLGLGLLLCFVFCSAKDAWLSVAKMLLMDGTQCTNSYDGLFKRVGECQTCPKKY